MIISHDCSKIQQQSAQISDRKILTWLRQRISPYHWGTSRNDKSNFWAISHNDVTRMFRNLRNGQKAFIAKPTNKIFMDHVSGAMSLHFAADGSKKTPETLVVIDIDVHDRGSAAGALACAEYLRDHHFPGLHFEPSSGGQGLHCLLRVDKRGIDALTLDRALLRLEKWLKNLHREHGWDIQGIEVKGRPPIFLWGCEKNELLDLRLGQLCRLPTRLFTDTASVMGTTLVTVNWMSRLDTKPVQGVQEPILASMPELGGFDQVNPQDLKTADWMPSMRDREWPHWIMKVARDGVPEEDKLGVILHELAKWMLWIELYDDPEKAERAQELITTWLLAKHNDRVSRLGTRAEKDVLNQVRRAVRLAARVNDHGKMIMAMIRQKRDSGKYQVVFLIAGLMGGVEEVGSTPSLPSTYSMGLRTDLLPAAIEAKLDQVAKQNKFRKRNGAYPLVTFSRTFLREIWDQKGQARISQASLDGIADTHQHTKYRQLLREAGVILDYDGTYRSGSAPMLYRLSDNVRALFHQEQAQEIRTA